MTRDENTLNAYMFGSKVYGSNDINSDDDYILIVKEHEEARNPDEHVYTVEQFQSLIDHHDIQALECLFLHPAHIIRETHKFTFKLDLQKLRVAISTIASNSFVKGKKKITVMGDYDLRAGIKSVFHSLRILDYGIQIAQHGRIIDYKSMNWVLPELWKMSFHATHNELWEAINIKFKPLYNAKSSQFKQLAPKDISEKDKLTKLKAALNSYCIDEWLNDEDYRALIDNILNL